METPYKVSTPHPEITKHVFIIESWRGFLPGYYFEDEDGSFHGPFATWEDAFTIFSNYCEGLE